MMELCAYLLGNLVHPTLSGQVPLSREKDQEALKCGFGVWELGICLILKLAVQALL